MAYRSNFTGAQIDAAIEKAHKTGSADPTINTVGVLGQRYFNTTTGATFECTATITVDEVTTYTWRNVIANNLTETVAGKALDATKGKALNDLISTHTGETVYKVYSITRDLSVAGVQSVSLSDGMTPKYIKVSTHVNASIKESEGYWNPSEQWNKGVIAGTAAVYQAATAIRILDAVSDTTAGTIQNVTATGLEINWVKGGVGATGTAAIRLEVFYH